jgi:hypothetical protein
MTRPSLSAGSSGVPETINFPSAVLRDRAVEFTWRCQVKPAPA